MNLVTLLTRYGPMTTSRAAQILQEHGGLSAEAARQRVSRRRETVRTLHGLPFPKRARFIYLDQQFGTDNYWSALIQSIHDANPAYAAALGGLRARGDLALDKHFEIICGSPTLQKGQLASSVVLQRLVSVKLLEVLDIEGIGACVALAHSSSERIHQARRLRARLMTEGVLLDAIRSWAGRMNLVSPKTTRIRDEHPAPRFSTFRFDLTGPSYLQPLIRFSSSQLDPGFLVADVLLGEELDTTMVSAFLRKCSMLSGLKKVRPFLPMLVADSFTADALRLCRSKGVIATRPETVFGQDVAKALEDLLQTLTHAASATPSQIEGLFRRLSSVEGAAGNLRGALFELIVGHCVRELEGGSVDLGLIVTDIKNGKRAEIDVRLIKQRQIKVYECKGYQPESMVPLKEIEQWLREKIPTIYSALRQQEQFSGATIGFEFWTCGWIDEEALKCLREAQTTTRKYTIDWKTGADVRSYVQGMASPGLKRILNEHYFNHPMAVFGRNTRSGQGTKDSNRSDVQSTSYEDHL